MKIPTSAIARTIEALRSSGARKATTYLGSRSVVKATYRFKPNKRDRTTDIVLTMGAPNYEERAFIKRCFKAGEPLPVKKVQLKHWPEPKRKCK